MSAPTVDLLGALGLHPDQIAAKRAARERAAAPRPARRAARPVKPRKRGTSYVCTDEILAKAHAMHMDDMSIREVARELFDECYSASPKALANALLTAFRGRGWPIRPASEATALKNRQRATRPTCSHIHQLGERKGSRCDRRCVGNDLWCWHHNPENIAAGLERLRAGGKA